MDSHDLRRVWFPVAICFLCAIGLLPSPYAGAGEDLALRQAILAAEHNRAQSDSELAVLTQAIENHDPEIQCLAVRALGRLERPDLAERIQPLLAATAPLVRQEAAIAYGRALLTDKQGAAAAGACLRKRLELERDGNVRAALCLVLGRLPYQAPEDVRSAATALIAATRTPSGQSADATSWIGAARGLESLIRLRVKLFSPEPATIERLKQMTGPSVDTAVRRLALASLIAAGRMDPAFLDRILRDKDAQVRRIAVKASGSLPAGEASIDTLLSRALKDPSAMVRFDALSAYSRRRRLEGCSAVLSLVNDPAAYVSLQAIDLIPNSCRSDQAAGTLSQIASKLPSGIATRGWHAPSHALVALTRMAPDAARSQLARFAAHPQWQVRMYAARAAAAIGYVPTLEALARDSNDNVRNAALTGLMATRKHEADAFYIEALAARDYQLVSTAVRALAGAPDKTKAAAALGSALNRITAEHRDTSRDPRVAILQRLRELGSAEQASLLKPYLEDFDPRVAASAADILTTWTGTQYLPVTKRLDPGTPPGVAEIRALNPATATVMMQGGHHFELRLFTAEAPATVLRFVRLASSGYYNGLTFHRVEPNFVIQGGSPGANELMGDARYMRDELGAFMHARGTVGISTRGRDTGDAQIFINLADNPRLDIEYMVFAEVIKGMDVVEGILEGDVIERVTIHSGTAKARRVERPRPVRL
jgi:cyclophilin family peptidyl-prolyl cis-trans isomerase/HEAT repeat protein